LAFALSEHKKQKYAPYNKPMAKSAFQKAVLGIAIVIFVIAIVTIVFTIHKSNTTTEWPPVVGDCPDYWADGGEGGSACVNTHRLGKCNLGGVDDSKNFAVQPYNDGDHCAKMKWANQCGVVWDGITTSAEREKCSSS
jgi:hypothetical protein